ncbi:MAG: transcription elongation factor [Opitutae bacterium]|nr:transcription elongation factor [Opitutae bacterium]
MDKTALRHAILTALQAELALQTEAANTARDEATNEESRAEDRFDMRSQSAAYLAAGQARIASEVADAIAAYTALTVRAFRPDEPLAIGALVALEAHGRRVWYFIGPQHGGLDVTVDGVKVTVVTGASPLGRQLVGRKVGDSAMLPGRTGAVMHAIAAVE